MTGITPLAPSQDVAGPLAADLLTCASMLGVLMGRPLSVDSAEGVSGLRIGVLREPGELDRRTAAAYAAAVHHLSRPAASIVNCGTDLHRRANYVSLLSMPWREDMCIRIGQSMQNMTG